MLFPFLAPWASGSKRLARPFLRVARLLQQYKTVAKPKQPSERPAAVLVSEDDDEVLEGTPVKKAAVATAERPGVPPRARGLFVGPGAPPHMAPETSRFMRGSMSGAAGSRGELVSSRPGTSGRSGGLWALAGRGPVRPPPKAAAPAAQAAIEPETAAVAAVTPREGIQSLPAAAAVLSHGLVPSMQPVRKTTGLAEDLAGPLLPRNLGKIPRGCMGATTARSDRALLSFLAAGLAGREGPSLAAVAQQQPGEEEVERFRPGAPTPSLAALERLQELQQTRAAKQAGAAAPVMAPLPAAAAAIGGTAPRPVHPLPPLPLPASAPVAPAPATARPQRKTPAPMKRPSAAPARRPRKVAAAEPNTEEEEEEERCVFPALEFPLGWSG